MKKVPIFILIFLILVQAGCTTQSQTKPPMGKNVFKREFLADCKGIKTIYEGHNSSGYYFEDYSGGASTKHSISLSEMASWLKECGVDPSSVSQIIE